MRALLGRGLVGLAVAVAAAACGEEPIIAPDLTCEGQPDVHCDHPIDRVLIPRLRALGLQPRDASPDELCRRAALDLAGRAPNARELAACRTQTPGEIVDAFMADPDYVRTQQRAWGEVFGYDALLAWSDDIVDMDRLVGELYRGELTYADFAVEIGMTPGLVALHPGDSWTTALWSIFLGRTARADEVAAMRPLTMTQHPRVFCDRGAWWNQYAYYRAIGNDEPTAVANANAFCIAVRKPEWSVNACLCTPRDGFAGCTSSVLGGDPITITPACVDPTTLYSAVNMTRVPERTPGADSSCPDGSNRPECADRDVLPDNSFAPLLPLPRASATTLMELSQIGRRLAMRGDFWEAAADRELRKLLGWWQATFRHPDSDIPEIRTLLADQLRSGATLAEIQRVILTSQLYVQPAEAPAADNIPDHGLPPWTAGPTKLLSGETWLATAGAAVGFVPQRCDYRWVQGPGYGAYLVDPRQVDRIVSSLDARYYDGFSTQATIRLGGCNADTKKPEVSNVGLAFNAADLARGLCAYGPDVLPFNWSGDRAEAASNLIERIWHRAPAPGEVDALVADMTACTSAYDPATPAGCQDPAIAVRWMCTRMIDSVEFATY